MDAHGRWFEAIRRRRADSDFGGTVPAALSDLETLALAAVLRLDDEAYGVAIRAEIERCTGRSVSVGSLYKALHRLERRGMVSTFAGEPTAVRGGRSKKHVRIEPSGRAALQASVAGYQRLFDGIDLEAR